MFYNYLRTAIRNLLKYKIFSLVNILGLASSMSVCMLIMLMLSDQYKYDAFHSRKDRTFRILTEKPNAKMGLRSAATSSPVANTLLSEHTWVEEATRLELGVGGDAMYNQEKVELRGFFAEPSFFRVFDFQLVEGDATTALSLPNSIVITSTIAEELFGSDDAVGKLIDFSDRGLNLLKGIDIEKPSVDWGQFVVTGVLNTSGAKSHLNFDALFSSSTQSSLRLSKLLPGNHEDWLDHNTGYSYVVLARGVQHSDLSAALDDLARRKLANSEEGKGVRLVAQRLTEITPGPFVSSPPSLSLPREAYYFLFVLAAIVLFLSCLNYINLSTARALSRAREVGVRKVNGARRQSLVFQFLGESVVLTFIALGLAIVLLMFLRSAFNNLWINQYLGFDLAVSVKIYLLFAVFALFVGVFAGIYPAFVLSGFNPVSALRGEGNKVVGKIRLQKILGTLQFVISLCFIITSLVVYNQFKFHTDLNYGFTHEQIINVSLQSADYSLARNILGAVPGVGKVSAIDEIPGSGQGTHGILLGPTGTDAVETNAVQFRVTPEFFDNLGVSLLAGKNLPPEFSDRLIVVNESAAKALGYEPVDIIGQVFRSNIDSGDLEVVGVVTDFRFRMPSEPGGIGPLILRNQNRFKFLQLKLMGSDHAATIAAMEREWVKADPLHPMKYQFYSEQLRSTNKAFMDVVSIVSFFAVIAIIIACMGLLGIITYQTERRNREVGIRKILGAGMMDLTLLLSMNFIKMLAAAICIGIPLAYFGNQAWLENFPNHIEIDLRIILDGTAILLLLVFLTTIRQLWTTGRRNPAIVLRTE